MNKFYNKSKHFGSWYKNVEEPKFNWKYIKDFYARNSPFFDDNANHPWINSGLKNQTNYKIRYLSHLKLIQIAFEGSKSIFDWIINFFYFGLFKIKPYKNMKIIYKTHIGFTKSYKSIQDELHQQIKDICKNNEVRDIEIFGHSYGGAMSQLCLEDLTYHYVEQLESPEMFRNHVPTITAMTIGAPRVFYKVCKKSWERIQTRLSRLILVANVNDLVTHCPPSIVGTKHILPQYGVGNDKCANIFKILNPLKYHIKSNYTKEINKQED